MANYWSHDLIGSDDNLTRYVLQKAAKLLKVTLERLYEELCREATSPSEGTPETFVPFEHDFAKKKKEVGT